MLNLQKKIKQALDTVLTTYLEQFKSSNASLPCVTMLEISNLIDGQHQGDTLAWSRIYYELKLYAADYADIDLYSPKIDKCMRELGFVRRASKDIIVNGQICKDFTYELLTEEYFD